MEYLWSLLIFVGIWALTTVLSGILGLLIPLLYLALGFILGTESLVLGIGALLGSLFNIYNVNRYMRTEGAMSHAPSYSKIASLGFIIVFIATIILKYLFEFEIGNINYWYMIAFVLVTWIILSSLLKNRRFKSLDRFKESVLRYRIVEKYSESPKWAIYLYLKNGNEGWNQTIPGSFLAKDPENDLTFVFDTKEDALNHAQNTFQNAECLED